LDPPTLAWAAGDCKLAVDSRRVASALDLVLPGRLLLRALDDLHELAVAARSLPGIEHRLTERVDALESRAAATLELGEAILGLGRRIDERGAQVLAQGELLAERAAVVAEEGGRLADAIPTLRRAIEIVDPLQGTVERLGRMMDRLPGGRPREP
jgi:hypothetical protein